MADTSLPRYPSGPDGGDIRGQVGDGIAVTTSRNGFGHQYGYRAIVTVNRRSSEIPWDQRSVLWMSPGQHHLRVEAEAVSGRRTGPADYVVQVGGGRPVEVEYQFFAARGFGTGALGPAPQPPLQPYNIGPRNVLIVGLIGLALTAAFGIMAVLGVLDLLG